MIGTGAVIRVEIPPYGIVIENPNTRIKYRFNKKEKEMLINSKW